MFVNKVTKLSKPILNTINQSYTVALKMSSSAIGVSAFKTLAVSVPKPYVYHVELNRPAKLNAMDNAMWSEFGQCFDELKDNADCRAIIVSGSGRLFCAGIDLQSFMQVGSDMAEAEDIARKAKIIGAKMAIYQHCFTSMEKCNKPVIAAVHSACIGAGVDLISATDIRYCTKDAFFQVKETAIGMAADVGSLQRLPKLIGSDSLVRELCYTARKMHADEALSSGLVSKVCTDKDSMMKNALEVAEQIAEHSPVAVQGTKKALIYARDHSVPDSLQAIADWNIFMLQSEDFLSAVTAQLTKDKPVFSKL